jgi:type VI secretion system protein ImpG
VTNEQPTLDYYLKELAYLRDRGREFAQRYPAVGKELDLMAGRPGDPHVERLIESFAFLTGRLQEQLDAGFPRISSALLAQLYPPLATIVPSLAIACFEADLEHGKWTTGCRIEAGTALWTRHGDEAPCRFRTCYPVTLWPMTAPDSATPMG